MPQGITIAAFVLGSVFLMLALVGGGFKIFAAEISGKVGPIGRAIAGLLGSILVLGGLLGWFDQKNATEPAVDRQLQSAKDKTSEVVEDPPPSSRHTEKHVSERMESSVDVNGYYEDGSGTVFSITRSGQRFTFQSQNPYTGLTSSGSGMIKGYQFTSTFQTNLPSTGSGSGTISEDGRTISGNYHDTVLGQYTLTLVKR